MADPIIELIVQDMVGAVNAVTLAAGYNQDLTAVRPKRQDLTDEGPAGDGTVVITHADPEPDLEHSNAGFPERQAWRLNVTLVAYVIPSDDSTAALDTLINRVRADLERALLRDPTRGGLAVWTRPAGSQKFIAEGGSATGVAVFADVLYRTPIDDPYTSAG